jgi:integrase/recombinase XerD
LYDILKKQELENLYETFIIPKENDSNRNQNWFKTSQLTSRRNKVILGLMIWQGLGTRELEKLEVKDLKLREGKLYIKGSRKSNERELNLESHQILDIMEYTLQVRQEIVKLSNKHHSDSLFVGVGGGSNFNNIMQALVKKLNQQNARIKNVKQIRASVITDWLQHYNLREVQYKAGHRYVSSTEAYLVNDFQGLQEDITKYHPIG